jgi:hypothetical protein
MTRNSYFLELLSLPELHRALSAQSPSLLSQSPLERLLYKRYPHLDHYDILSHCDVGRRASSCFLTISSLCHYPESLRGIDIYFDSHEDMYEGCIISSLPSYPP